MIAPTVFETAGIIGSLIMCVSAIPQIVKTCRTKSARDISLGYLAALAFGLALVQIYSVHAGDVVFIFGNTLSLVLTLIMVALWFRYTPAKRAVQGPE